MLSENSRKKLDEQVSNLEELRKALWKCRRGLNGLSLTTLLHLNLSPTQTELKLILSFLDELIKYQNRVEAEQRRH